MAVNPSMRVLVVGGGFTGRRFATAMAARHIPVTLTRRTLPEAPRARQGLRWLQFDSRQAMPYGPEAFSGTSHVLVTTPPDGGAGDGVLQRLHPVLSALPLEWVGYLSTTGVYGDTGGDWVDESSPTTATLNRSRARLEAEQAWLTSGLPVQSFRLPAIYGPGRSPFAALRRGESRLIHKPGQVFSRVHVDDIVGALLHCLALPGPQRPAVLNVADHAPCPSTETLSYAAHLLGLKLPAVEVYGAIAGGMGAMARSFWSENRRASNRLLTETLGYPLVYPTYREGYRACLAEEEAAAGAAQPPD